jgi:Fe2+ or Zn2+ uptake regulation protein/predicted transcriptional regulator
MTHQREIILDELNRSKTHPTADELYSCIKKNLPRISLATVYRNLEILSEAGLIQKLQVSGRQKRFDWNPEVHNHIFCTQCQGLDNIPTPDAGATPYVGPMQEKGYCITGCRIEFFGLCPKCQTKTPNNDSQKGVSQMGCKTCGNTSLNDRQRQVLEALAQSPEACGSKEIVASTGMEAKQVSSQITELKSKGYVTSPVRCKYAITEQGKKILG